MAFHKILYCRWFFVALLACLALPITVTTQEERPQITPGERKPTKKKDAGPRAVAVLQLAANGKASLVPIAILVGGKFWDASAYKADPIPMSLEPGTVYEAERAGSSLGLFTVNSALHSNAANVQTPWLGTGSWVPAGTEKPKTALEAEKEPIGIESTRRASPPHQERQPAKTGAHSPARPSFRAAAKFIAGNCRIRPGEPWSAKSGSNKSRSNKSQSAKPGHKPESNWI